MTEAQRHYHNTQRRLKRRYDKLIGYCPICGKPITLRIMTHPHDCTPRTGTADSTGKGQPL